MRVYTIQAWYWLGPIGLYSSASNALVAATDAIYLAWLAAGNAPTPWPKDATGAQSAAALDAVLAASGLPPFSAPPAPTLAQLRAYANDKAAGLLAAMRSYSASGVTLKSDATAATLSYLMALEQWGAANPTLTTNWVANDDSVTVLTGAEIIALAPPVGVYALGVYSTQLASVLAQIAAGTITTLAGIDAFGWTV